MRDYVIYFSLSSDNMKAFHEFVNEKGINYQPKNSFSILGEEDVRFNDPRDLITLIEKFDNRAALHVIIDYISFWRENEKIENYSNVIRDIIMTYPEVQFVFDETVAKRKAQIKKKCRSFDYLNFLFNDPTIQNGEICMTSPDEKIRKIHVLSDFHCFDMGNDEDSAFNQFILLLRGRNNIYDASNLRAAIKQYKFEKLHVDDNYKELNKSRRENAAVVVEEEYHQAMFNSYCLYANGYRVFPIMTAAELVWINEKKDILAYINEQKSKTLLVRDYDLQFIDEKNPSVKKKREDCNKKNSTTYNTVDLIRGAKRNQEPGRETNQEQERKAKFKLINTKENPFWNGFEGCDKFFISKGDDDVEVDLKSNKLMAVTKEKLILQGIKKPIEGIYASVQQFDFVKRRYVSSRDEDSFVTRRIEGDHSCPLDIYGIARAMVHRAENYYYRKNYRLAAVVAGEALLVLNGFHRSLMCRAYYIQAVSENAIAMSLLGGEEERLQEDIKIRLGNKLQEEVARLIKSPDRKNLLYNIYNDCMLFCKEREYFNAADEVLNIMVQVKEGVDLIKWFKDIKKRIEKLLEKKKKDNKLTERKVDKLS